MLSILAVVLGLAVVYLGICGVLLVAVQQLPRRPVKERPDWGRVEDTVIRAVDGKRLELWRVFPDGPSRGVVVLAHGWGRNRDRMVGRARMFGRWGFTTVLHSARDHGGSDRKWFVNALRFAEDIESVLDWVGEPVILYGHSAGAGGAIIAASRNRDRIRLLFLEGVYARTREALLSLYTWVHPAFGRLFGPAVLWLMEAVYRGAMARYSPVRLAPRLPMPVMLIHGEHDQRFPVAFARELAAAFPTRQVTLHIAPGAGHSDSSTTPGYAPAVRRFLQERLAAEDLSASGAAHGR